MKKQNIDQRLKVFQSPIFQTNSTVFVGDEFVLVVDPTWLPHEVQAIRDYVEEVRGERTLYLFYTHGDFDHILAAGLFPDGINIGSVFLREYPEKASALEQVHHFDAKYYLKRDYPVVFPEIQLVITEDGQQIQLGETKATCYLMPGHTFDGAMLYLESYGIWIVGDYFSDVEFPSIYDTVEGYKQTISKSQHWWGQIQDSINWMIPGHGSATADRQEMQRRFDVSKQYLEELECYVRDSNPDQLNQLYEKSCVFPSEFSQSNHNGNVEKMKEYLLRIDNITNKIQ